MLVRVSSTEPAAASAVDVRRCYVTPAEVIVATDVTRLEVWAGDFLCIHGASGSGKSTLLRLLTGLEVPDEGSIEITGTRIDQLGEGARTRIRLTHIGVVFQHDNLIEEFTAVENVGFPLELLGRDAPSVREESEAMLERVGLTGVGDRWPHELSGGQQQRVGVARALIGERQLLVADEPTGALDSANSRELYGLLRDLASSGIAVVVASHDPEARDYATRIAEMVDGRLHES